MVPPPLRKKNPFIIFSPSGCLALFSSFRGVRGIKLNDPSKNSSDDQDWSYPWRAWVLLSSALLWLLSCFMHKGAKLRMSQKRTMLWGQCAILPAAREEPHGKDPLTEAVLESGLFPISVARCRGVEDVVGWLSLTFSLSFSIALLTGSREQRGCLPVSFPKQGRQAGCRHPFFGAQSGSLLRAHFYVLAWVVPPKGNFPNCAKRQQFSNSSRHEEEPCPAMELPPEATGSLRQPWPWAFWDFHEAERPRSTTGCSAEPSRLRGNLPKGKPDVGIAQSWIIHRKCVSKTWCFSQWQSSSWRSRKSTFCQASTLKQGCNEIEVEAESCHGASASGSAGKEILGDFFFLWFQLVALKHGDQSSHLWMSGEKKLHAV